MAQIPNIENLTINPVEVQDLREVIAQAIYQDPNWARLHAVADGISKKTQILLDDSSGKLGWKATGCAVVQSGGASIKLAQKYWEPVTIEDMIDFCQADLDVNFKPLVIRNAADKFGALTDQEAINIFVSAKLEQYLKEAVQRLAFLGDTEIENVADGGNLKDTVNVKFYNSVDGWWKQMVAGVVATTTPHTNIAANEEATKALQLSALTDAAAFAVIKGIYDKADDALKLDANAYIWATPAIYNGYKNYITSGEFANGGFSEKIINGVSNVAYQGIPIYTDVFLGKLILNDFEVSDGASPAVMTYDFPHRAYMATPDVLPMATTNIDDFGKLESEYVWKDRKSYVRFDFAIDAKVIRPDMISVAY